MGAILGNYGLVRYQSLTFRVTVLSASDNVANSDLVTTSGFLALPLTVPASPLRVFLTGTYASDAAAETAFRAIGGEITYRPTSTLVAGDALTFGWTAAGPSFASLTIAGDSGGFGTVIEVTIRAPHSIIQ